MGRAGRPFSPLRRFVEAQPTTMRAKDVVERARAAGFASATINVVRKLQSRVRLARKGYDTSAATADPTAAYTNGSTAPPSPMPMMTASEFIRSLPFDLVARRVVEKGKEAGFTFRRSLVYEAREGGRRRQRANAAKRRAETMAPQEAKEARPTAPSAATELRTATDAAARKEPTAAEPDTNSEREARAVVKKPSAGKEIRKSNGSTAPRKLGASARASGQDRLRAAAAELALAIVVVVQEALRGRLLKALGDVEAHRGRRDGTRQGRPGR